MPTSLRIRSKVCTHGQAFRDTCCVSHRRLLLFSSFPIRWPPCCCSSIPDMFLPQRLCTCSAFCLDPSSLSHVTWSLTSVLVFAQMPPYPQRAFPDHFMTYNPSLLYSLYFTFFIFLMYCSLSWSDSAIFMFIVWFSNVTPGTFDFHCCISAWIVVALSKCLLSEWMSGGKPRFVLLAPSVLHSWRQLVSSTISNACFLHTFSVPPEKTTKSLPLWHQWWGCSWWSSWWLCDIGSPGRMGR